MLSVTNIERGDHLNNPYPTGFGPVNVLEGQSREWVVRRFTVDQTSAAMFNLRLIRDGQSHRIVPPGEYTRLCHRQTVVMSDTPAEAHEHTRLYHKAKGRVLFNGLGLGFCLAAILRKPEVEHVTVIEQSSDVIKLVAPSIIDTRVEIIHADALEWRPAKGQRFDCVWHDIWPDICDDNKVQMTKLRRAYARRTDWQDCWSSEYL